MKCPYRMGQTGILGGQRYVVFYVGTSEEEAKWGIFRVLKLNPRNPDHAVSELSYPHSLPGSTSAFTPDDPTIGEAIKGEGAEVAALRARCERLRAVAKATLARHERWTSETYWDVTKALGRLTYDDLDDAKGGG